MSKQKRAALQNLDEHQSPFKCTKTQTIFRNTANLSLRGNTYDVMHLDKFLDSEYGDKTFNGNNVKSVTGAVTQNNVA